MVFKKVVTSEQALLRANHAQELGVQGDQECRTQGEQVRQQVKQRGQAQAQFHRKFRNLYPEDAPEPGFFTHTHILL